jgi:hypothetical protein
MVFTQIFLEEVLTPFIIGKEVDAVLSVNGVGKLLVFILPLFSI